ncbi:aldehyde dehydrogenase family protein [Steroidobacter cummioxidans]|uniref:aldehyde dehydrogenase family protein n=1 Tax=Steroidobacter cummioxidans TaxID=1803913 RepID=UPI0019D45FC9|nr:aldehyde dehydrogenase family protein [Steroidobacter cummioxidans]
MSNKHTLNKHFIGGEWVVSANAVTMPIINPATAESIGTLALGNAADVDNAVRAARKAFASWSKTSGRERANYLRAIAQQIRDKAESLGQLSSLNNGKPLSESSMDMGDAAATYEYYATLAEQLDSRQGTSVPLQADQFSSTTYLEPAGVVGLIVPWNFPFVTTAWKVAPALAAGCTVVLKPSEVTPLVEFELATIAQTIGLPPGVLNIVGGDGAGVGAALVDHPDVAKISFTGSNRVGERVMQAAARRMANVSLELGGKSPILVFEDADPQQAAELIAGGIFFNCGQMCSATSRLLVHRDVAPAVLERLKAVAEATIVGDAFAEGVTMGPLTSANQLQTVCGYIERGIAEGLQLLTGGARLSRPGYFVEPTIFLDVPSSSALWREEIFGPVLCVRTFATEQEALELANDTDFGLAATIVTADAERARRVARALQAGHIWINGPQAVFPETSWGGFKRSGLGRELGPWGLQAFLEVKQVTQPVQ